MEQLNVYPATFNFQLSIFNFQFSTFNFQLSKVTIDLIVIGKTDSADVASLVETYSKRINRCVKFSLVALPDIKGTRKLSAAEQKAAEGKLLLAQTGPGDHVVLLDEHGMELRSVEFAAWLEKRMAGISGGSWNPGGTSRTGGAGAAAKRICFVVGGPYGFSPEVYARANERLALSRMTFSHQIIRAIFAEQLYRAFSIIRNEPYHNS
jgi:23S rRNA (pseudouridine1915-N3)-methyltransferase